MLEKIIAINNVGVLQAAVPGPVRLDKLTLVYADNARGKSTFSSLLRACAEGDVSAVLERKTFGADAPPRVLFRFKNGVAGFNSEFDGTVWSAQRANLYVFNQEFVARNVYAGGGVKPEHREALLEFALGTAAVAQRAEFDKQAELQRQKAVEVSAAEGALQGYRGEFSVDAFIALEPLEDAEKQIESIEKSLAEARDAERIRNRPAFRRVAVPAYDFAAMRAVAASTFTSLATAAEETVQAHFAAHNGSSTERWVSEGLHHKPEASCPFCGQSTEDLKLLKAYRTYFDEAYKEHLRNVAAMPGQAATVISEQQIEEWRRAMEFNSGALSAWESSVELTADTLPTLDVEALLAIARTGRQRLQAVAEQKVERPLVALPLDTFDEVAASLESLVDSATAFNAQVDELNAKLEAHKSSLATADAAALQRRRQTLSATVIRHEAATVELVQAVLDARRAFKAAQTAKDIAKSQLDSHMGATLAQFQGDINAWLVKFGAPFLVQQLAPTYRGGGVRSEYVLSVRGARVTVGPGEDGDLSFDAALSEGDKRTLAFAFFLARLLADADRGKIVVVLDDVFTSLDRHRRYQTAEAVIRIGAECAQVIALGHDAHFLRELKKRASKKKVGPHIELALHRDGNEYSFLAGFDLDEYCASDYYKHYMLVERFLGGDNTVSLLEVAKALRPLVEGHLHRCFPKQFKEGQSVGDMLEHIRNAAVGTPLACLQPHLRDLVNFNEFASAYHHDTADSEARTEANSTEMLPFAKGAIGFIQSRTFA